jgi:hypothetical protein
MVTAMDKSIGLLLQAVADLGTVRVRVRVRERVTATDKSIVTGSGRSRYG